MLQSIKLDLKLVFFYLLNNAYRRNYISNTLLKKTKEPLFTFLLLPVRELKLCVLYFSTPFYNTADLKNSSSEPKI